MAPVMLRASTILGAFEQAQTELVGKAVILTDGKAGTVEGRLARRMAWPANFDQRPRWQVANLHPQVYPDGLNASFTSFRCLKTTPFRLSERRCLPTIAEPRRRSSGGIARRAAYWLQIPVQAVSTILYCTAEIVASNDTPSSFGLVGMN